MSQTYPNSNHGTHPELEATVAEESASQRESCGPTGGGGRGTDDDCTADG